MADTTQFDHDRISHLLADRLLQVPNFQRSYSWDEGNVRDFLNDLEMARNKKTSYFLGTVVFADSENSRQLIVDGQQRLATTAILLIAIRDTLIKFNKNKQAEHIDETYLRGYDLEAEELTERIILNSEDQPIYDKLLEHSDQPLNGESPIIDAYLQCIEYLEALSPTEGDYKKLVEIVSQLEETVQVLVAVASSLSEAYVIFETLNDRGADLTTADLLKNYLFSQAKSNFDAVQAGWIRVSAEFEKPEDFVKFIRYEYMSRNGHATMRNLYKLLLSDIGSGPKKAKEYILRLEGALVVYLALKDVDSSLLQSLDFDTRDAVLAMRRFGLESSYPLIMAAFQTWDDRGRSARLFVRVVNWSIRALFAGRLGGSVAEKAFSDAARSISQGDAKNQDDVKIALERIIVSDEQFRTALQGYGKISIPRARYLLAMLERAYLMRKGASIEAPADWLSRSVTIEHLVPRAEAKKDSLKATYVETLGNMALLERTINREVEDRPFAEKAPAYASSSFELTALLSSESTWNKAEVEKRAKMLAHLAPLAWPL